uniref:Gypsy retrotransposon integrase-like protein 1 n=1 Tax=Pelodiscus sinensis TaxID=13735 RepID=K7EXE6_PELSI
MGVAPALRGTQQEFQEAQQSDESLERAREEAQNQTPATVERGRFLIQEGLLYREPPPGKKGSQAATRRQLVVPEAYREELLRVAHDGPFAGHLGVGKTCDRLEQNFYWPRMFGSVREYCRSCELCQKRKGSRGPRKAPLQPLPIIGEAFARVSMDIVGPLPRPSRNGKKYILVVVDFATRYPEAVALSNVEAETVATALFTVFSRVGFPREVLSDRGSNFMSVVFRQLWELCGVKHLKAAPYHPQTNGLVERFNGTLKSMLKMYVDRRQNDWDVLLPYLLYAYRSVAQDSMGFAPFELLYGRQVRGPLDLIRDAWEGNVEVAGQPAMESVTQFKDRLKEMMELVRENLSDSQGAQKAWYDRDAVERAFEIGDLVLVLDPVRRNKMQDVWSGPYEVVERVNEVTYDVRKASGRGGVQTVHVNRMKVYMERGVNVNMICCAEEEAMSVPLVDMVAESQEETPLESIEMGEGLTSLQRGELLALLKHHRRTFSNRPGLTDRISHSIHTTGPRPAPSRAYRAKGEMQRQIQEEVESMLASPDFNKPFWLCTDASNIGLGAVLMQDGAGDRRHPVAYLSKKLSPAEQNYATIEKECYAIVWAVKQLKPYLYNRRFTVLSDHAPLVWLHKAKGTNSRLLRWSLALQEYDMDIVHIRGKENIVADALSRAGEPM